MCKKTSDFAEDGFPNRSSYIVVAGVQGQGTVLPSGRGAGVQIKGAGEAFAWARSTCSPSPWLTAHLPLANLAHTPADVDICVWGIFNWCWLGCGDLFFCSAPKPPPPSSPLPFPIYLPIYAQSTAKKHEYWCQRIVSEDCFCRCKSKAFPHLFHLPILPILYFLFWANRHIHYGHPGGLTMVSYLVCDTLSSDQNL